MRTQKAKGILKGLPRFIKELDPPDRTIYEDGKAFAYRLISNKKAVANYIKASKDKSDLFPMFARPCPLKPAHGFVDSHPIHNAKELRKVFAEVKKADPDGEVILAKSYQDISSNFIYVDDGLLCVGPGNDGATNGNNSISFPVCPDKVNAKTKEISGIGSEDSVYMEGIRAQVNKHSGYDWRLVQLRGGPEMICGSKDFIPSDTKVTNVVEPHDDLIAWANEVSEFKPGTVVVGKGHTMASHAAVHCILHSVPFITSFTPKVGSEIKATEEGKVDKISREDFRKGAHVAMNSDLYSMGAKRILYFSFSVLHNWAYLRKSEHASWLLGAASASLSSLCSALVLGEYRHARNNRKPSRDSIYSRALGTGALKQIPKLPEALKSFCYGNNWASGFGGIKWGVCTHYTIKLYRALANVYNGQGNTVSDNESTTLLENFNRLVNLVHNGGWWFNKVANENDMNFCSDHPGLAAASVGDLYYNLSESIASVKKVREKLPTLTYVKPPLLNTDKGVSWAELDRGSLSDITGKAYVRVYSEADEEHKRTNVTLTKKEIKEIRGNPRRRYFLLPKKDKGFAAPGGRILVSI